jgi:hypothetical protein
VREAGDNAIKETTFSAGKKTTDGENSDIQTMAQAYKFGAKSLVLLQVNCRSICNKPLRVLEFG